MTIKFEPRDVWIGWYWDRRNDGTHHYVCIVPTLVIHWVRPVHTPNATGPKAPAP